MENKCKKCGEVKKLEYFKKNKNSAKGVENECLICNKERSKKFYLDNKERIKKAASSYRKINPDKVKYLNKKHSDLNKEKNKCYSYKYYLNNRIKIMERSSKWNKQNYKKVYENEKTRQIDPVYKLKIQTRKNISYAFYKSGYTKKSRTFEILGCEYDFFKNYIEAQFKKGMQWDNIHLDHIKPISIAKTEKEVIELNHYTNFQPLFAKDNLIKSAKLITKQLRLI